MTLIFLLILITDECLNSERQKSSYLHFFVFCRMLWVIPTQLLKALIVQLLTVMCGQLFLEYCSIFAENSQARPICQPKNLTCKKNERFYVGKVLLRVTFMLARG